MKIEIKNLVNGREFKAEFETEELLNNWLKSQLDKGMKCPWGKPAHHLEVDVKKAPSDRAVFVEEVLYKDPIKKDVVKYKYYIPCEYEIFKDETPIDKAPEYFQKLRKARTKKLSEYDWTQLADTPLTSEERGRYREYRQYLRDLPTQYNNNSIHSWSIMSFSDWKAHKGY